MKAQSKLFQATAIVNACADKAEALAMIMTELSVSKSNAFVYYTKATKGVSKPAKADKATKPAKESIQGTSSTKKAQKLAEIDAFLASNAASAKGNPFAALGS
jgi:meiotically up-regulated gene 157 (Mug157) protein